ncbi:J domain-containing protein [Thermomonas sp. HDW16]|uniref:J domain-containing protein n=1 Tax=Thermomonas sp. HDW16 TaxID=2714945 RepID=UPI00140D65CB|nr:J domain-containing protein [Thermomonas sp. HDW16]QIL21375.1 J domain-containing protein [Thermomonas sp. HDW16]
MTFLEGLVVASGLAIGYWLVSVFTKSSDDYDEAPVGYPDDPGAGVADAPWHEVLGVSEWASDEDVAAAYREKIGQYHPDKVATMGPEIRELAERKARQVNEAYRDARRRSRN